MRVFIKALLHETGEGSFEVLEHSSMTEELGNYDLDNMLNIEHEIAPFIDDLEEDEYCRVFLELELEYSRDYFNDCSEFHDCITFKKIKLEDTETVEALYTLV